MNANAGFRSVAAILYFHFKVSQMLIEFSVENFKSFRDRATFSMIAANLKSEDKRLDENNTIAVSDNLRLLTSAAIYGKNASGKSNLGAALKFMKGFVKVSANGMQSGDEIPVAPFRLSTWSQEEASSFEAVFLVEGVQYRYGFEVNRTQVLSEWLYYVPSRREYPLFERDGQAISLKAGFKEGRGLEARTRPNALFLSVVAQFNGTLASKILGWFQGMSVTSGLQDHDFEDFTIRCLRSGQYAEAILTFLGSLDVGVEELFVSEPDAETPAGETAHEWGDVFTAHPVFDEQGYVVKDAIFSVNREESQGTRKLIAIAGPLQSILQQGHVVFIDEMDARLHTYMTAAIVKLFNSKRTNPHGAQLVFVTHDTNLLDNTLLRRDQIWFAEKDGQGATHLRSLAEFRERNDADFQQRYLGGRYGGVPSVGDLSALVPETAGHG